MPPAKAISKNKDAILKKQVREIIEKCGLDNLRVDREVEINFTGGKDSAGHYLTEKEVDVIARFSYAGKTVLLLFECKNTNNASGVKKYYREYAGDVADIKKNLGGIRVLSSHDNEVKSHHFRGVDLIAACFAYGSNLPEDAYRTCLEAAKKHSFLVWNHLAITYYHTISSILARWTKYELFRDFGLSLEDKNTLTIPALKFKQKHREMFLGYIHPGLLLRIAYVVRRASEKTYAYQRMLSGERIRAIADFISSNSAQSFLPNAVIIVFDHDPKVQERLDYDDHKGLLKIPLIYCSAWIIDGQHRVYGFLGTAYERWSSEKFQPFDLPLIAIRQLPEVIQTQTFININYFQKRIKTGLLCDLTTLTKDLKHKLTWPSLIGRELDRINGSPLQNQVKISEMHVGRPINLSSLVQYGLLETLLGYKPRSDEYVGPLFKYAPFDRKVAFDSQQNHKSFAKCVFR